MFGAIRPEPVRKQIYSQRMNDREILYFVLVYVKKIYKSPKITNKADSTHLRFSSCGNA